MAEDEGKKAEAESRTKQKVSRVGLKSEGKDESEDALLLAASLSVPPPPPPSGTEGCKKKKEKQPKKRKKKKKKKKASNQDMSSPPGGRHADEQAAREESPQTDALERATEEEMEEDESTRVADDDPILLKLKSQVENVVEAKKRMARPLFLRSMAPEELRELKFFKSADGIESNLLILFHGMGDNESSYVAFAKALQLPQTSILALRAPYTLPMGLGHTWFRAFEPTGFPIKPIASERRRLATLDYTGELLSNLLTVLQSKCEWSKERIFLLGFSAGAQTALTWALQEASPGRFGGILCISSSLMEEHAAQAAQRKKQGLTPLEGSLGDTPVFISHGSEDKRVALKVATARYRLLNEHLLDGTGKGLRSTKAKTKTKQGQVQFRSYRKGHTMVNSKEEARDLMRFFSKHLYLRSLGLENSPDVIEIENKAS